MRANEVRKRVDHVGRSSEKSSISRVVSLVPSLVDPSSGAVTTTAVETGAEDVSLPNWFWGPKVPEAA